jgi:poly(A) polymerase
VKESIDFLSSLGIDFYFVGGYVRDHLLKRETHDIDIAVQGDALDVGKQVAHHTGGVFVVLDEEEGIARVANHGWNVDFSTIKGSLEDDLKRRDFTIDSLAQKPSGEIIDLFGGREDLQRGTIRAVTNFAFSEDPIRLLRAVRLSQELGFCIEEETKGLIQNQAHLISLSPKERIREEIVRILSHPNSAPALDELDRLGLLTQIIPELSSLKGVDQPPEHFFDVFEHSLKTVAYLEEILASEVSLPYQKYVQDDEVLLKISALLHDIAKPETKTMDEGRIRFLSHAIRGADKASQILTRLRFSKVEVRMVAKMVEYHLRPTQMAAPSELPTPHAIYRYFKDTGEVGVHILLLSLADHLAARGPNLDHQSFSEHVKLCSYVLRKREKEESMVFPPKLVSGHDIMHTLSITPSPRVGKILDRIREAQAEGKVKTRKEALDFVHQCIEET